MAMTRVTLEGMRAAEQEMQQTVESTNADLRRINAAVVGLQGTWTGVSATKFAGALNEWEAQCNRIVQAMVGLIGAMQTSERQYRSTEEQNTQSAVALGSGMQL